MNNVTEETYARKLRQFEAWRGSNVPPERGPNPGLRERMLAALANGPLNTSQLAKATGVSPESAVQCCTKARKVRLVVSWQPAGQKALMWALAKVPE